MRLAATGNRIWLSGALTRSDDGASCRERHAQRTFLRVSIGDPNAELKLVVREDEAAASMRLALESIGKFAS